MIACIWSRGRHRRKCTLTQFPVGRERILWRAPATRQSDNPADGLELTSMLSGDGAWEKCTLTPVSVALDAAVVVDRHQGEHVGIHKDNADS